MAVPPPRDRPVGVKRRIALSVAVVAVLGAVAWFMRPENDRPYIDTWVENFRPRTCMVDVIDRLGSPDEVWGRPGSTRDEMVFVYAGTRTYSIRFETGLAMEVIEGHVGGADAPVFSRQIESVTPPGC